jgi:uroporphyrinogen-III decarboxylase
MTDKQWNDVQKIINGEILDPLPVGFIIDSPWLPNWYGISILDYFSNDEYWLKANLKAVNDFPDIMFFPGFWSEYGMCTEPSAFGARCNFPGDAFPHAHKVIRSAEEIDDLPVPDPAKDGLLPFMLNRLILNQKAIEDAGHKIRFAVARGPLNIASYLMGSTEFLTTMMMQPEKAHLLMRKVTDFLKQWLQLQMDTFRSIDGILLLDDIIGFMGEEDFKTFGLPYFKELYDFEVSVKFLHNDAPCEASVALLPEIGVNLFNMGFETDMNQLKAATNNKITMLGNIPPRDVLANGNANDVKNAVRRLKSNINNYERIVFACGGGMPPGVSTDNIKAFYVAVCV